MLEIALVLPILLVLTMGVLDFGRAFHAKNMVDNAAREAARVTAVTGGDTAAGEARGDSLLVNTGIPGNTTVTPMAPDKTVTATVTSRFVFVTPGIWILLGLDDPTGIDMIGVCTMRVEGV